MDRTPIKIPGRRTRASSKAALAARKAPNRSRERPLNSSPASTKMAQSSKNPEVAKKRSLKNIKSRRKMSHLEKVPTELLVEIFLYSMNMDLPRSSPVIGAKLSSELIYTRTVIAAFGSTWHDGYGECKLRSNALWSYAISKHFPVLVDPKDDDAAVGALQSAILRCRWASLDIIQKSQEIWVRRHCEDRPFKPLPFVEERHAGEWNELQAERFSRPLKPADCFEKSYADFMNFIQMKDLMHSVDFYWTTYLDVASTFEIPQSLLLGPWTEDMTRMLFWLVKGGAKFNWLTSTSGEAALLGLKTAVAEGDVRAVHLLFWAGLGERVDIETVIWVIQNAKRNRLHLVMELLKLWMLEHHNDDHDKSLMRKTSAEIRDHVGIMPGEDSVVFVKQVSKALLVYARRGNPVEVCSCLESLIYCSKEA